MPPSMQWTIATPPASIAASTLLGLRGHLGVAGVRSVDLFLDQGHLVRSD